MRWRCLGCACETFCICFPWNFSVKAFRAGQQSFTEQYYVGMKCNYASITMWTVFNLVMSFIHFKWHSPQSNYNFFCHTYSINWRSQTLMVIMNVLGSKWNRKLHRGLLPVFHLPEVLHQPQWNSIRKSKFSLGPEVCVYANFSHWGLVSF